MEKLHDLSVNPKQYDREDVHLTLGTFQEKEIYDESMTKITTKCYWHKLLNGGSSRWPQSDLHSRTRPVNTPARVWIEKLRTFANSW